LTPRLTAVAAAVCWAGAGTRMGRGSAAEVSSLGRQGWGMLLCAKPTRVVGAQRLQKLLPGEVRTTSRNVVQKALENRSLPLGVVLAGFKPGIIREQQRFQLAVHPNQSLKWAASTATPSAAVIPG
jgi:hypothetical protein